MVQSCREVRRFLPTEATHFLQSGDDTIRIQIDSFKGLDIQKNFKNIHATHSIPIFPLYGQDLFLYISGISLCLQVRPNIFGTLVFWVTMMMKKDKNDEDADDDASPGASPYEGLWSSGSRGSRFEVAGKSLLSC